MIITQTTSLSGEAKKFLKEIWKCTPSSATIWFLAHIDSELAGLAAISVSKKCALFHTGGVAEKFRNRGVLTALVVARIDYCLETRPHTKLCVNTNCYHYVSRLYSRHGFVLTDASGMLTLTRTI